MEVIAINPAETELAEFSDAVFQVIQRGTIAAPDPNLLTDDFVNPRASILLQYDDWSISKDKLMWDL